jgi:hypothetical protein
MLMKATGSQIRHMAVKGQPAPHALQTESALGNLPRMVNCLVGNGGVRFREPACCAPAMASAAVSNLRNWWVGVVFRSDASLLLEFGGSRLGF